MAPNELTAFAGAVVHELRTPLSVVAGEIDLALARDRSPAAYRGALARIAERVAELIDLTTDIACLGDAAGWTGGPAGLVSLAAVFAALADCDGPRRGTPVAVDACPAAARVAGDDASVTGALALLVEHALKHRRDGSRVRLRALAPAAGTIDRATIDLLLDAEPFGFSAVAWEALAAGPAVPPRAGGPLRLAAAERLVRGCGGSLALTAAGGRECVRIRLEARTTAAGPGDGAGAP